MIPTPSFWFPCRNLLHLISLILIFSLILGCGGTRIKGNSYDPLAEFEHQLDQLLSNLLEKEKFTSIEMAPAAVMPGSIKSGSRFSRLEEIIIEKLSIRLRQNHDIHILSRRNWFEFREGRPLTFQEKPVTKRHFLKELIVYEVDISADDILEKASVSITATDAEGKSIAGVMSTCDFDFSYGAPARLLFSEAPTTELFPEGLEERPYVSLDRLSFSLAAELADAYQTEPTADGQKPSDSEVRVLLYSKPTAGITAGMVLKIQNALQQAIVGNRGFTCAVSRDDFRPAFRQIDFYRRNSEIFQLESSPFATGTVLMMVESVRHADGDKIGVAVRALWRITPLESNSGYFIPTNVSGTYISGFTSKAYLHAALIKDPAFTLTGSEKTIAEVDSPPYPEKIGTAENSLAAFEKFGELDVCFLKFSQVLEKRVYPILKKAPNIMRLQRSYEPCETEECLCYIVHFSGPQEDIESFIRKNLRTSRVLTFQMTPKGKDRLDVLFNGGFE